MDIHDTKSEFLNVICGVPQGSILGPKLFIIFINDICNISKIIQFILFADDTNIFCSDDDLTKLETKINQELSKLNDWFAINKLSLNVSKTNYMIFSNKNVNILKITICNTQIERVKSTRFLGIIIDQNLNWKEHIQRVKNKLSKTLAIMQKAKYYLDSYSIQILYNSLFLPYIEYCLEIWGCAYVSNLNCIFILQKRAIRLICNLKYRDHTNVYFFNLNLLKLFDLIDVKICVIMFKASKLVLPANVQSLFDTNFNHIYNTRSDKTFRQQKIRSIAREKCITQYGVKLWRKMILNHKELKDCKNIKSFKRLTKKIFIENYKL